MEITKDGENIMQSSHLEIIPKTTDISNIPKILVSHSPKDSFESQIELIDLELRRFDNPRLSPQKEVFSESIPPSINIANKFFFRK